MAEPAAAPAGAPVAAASGGDAEGTAPTQERLQAGSEPQNEDPEWDIGGGKKFKRSKVLNTLRAQASAQSAAHRQAWEAQQQAKALQTHLQSLGFDPDAFGKDPQGAFASAVDRYVRQKLEEAQMDPRDLENRKLKSELEERQRRLEEHEKQERQAAESARVDAKANEFAEHIAQALAASNLPRNPKTIARMAELMLAAARSNRQFAPEELAQRVAEQIFEEQGLHLQSFSGDGAKLAQWLGKENVESLRRHLLSETQSKFVPQGKQKSSSPRPRVLASKEHPNGYITFDQMLQMTKGK